MAGESFNARYGPACSDLIAGAALDDDLHGVGLWPAGDPVAEVLYRCVPATSAGKPVVDYESVAALRAALTSDSPDRRAEAYSDILQVDVQPTSILETPPDSAALRTLRRAGILAEERNQGPPASELWSDVVALLEEIRDNTGDE